jgi:hypothetical protein
MRRVVWLLALISACGDDKRPVQRGNDAAPVDSAWVPPDAAPPTVDAPPAPMPACAMDAGECSLPPSACLDQWYLLYYTGGDCVDGTCHFTTNLMWCPDTCQNGGCLPGFT